LTGGGPPPGQAAPRGTPVSRGRAWNLRSEPLAWVVLALGIIASGSAASAAVPEYSAVVVRTYPHDPGAFTEGLLYQDGFLYESTGLAGRSSIRKVDLATGTVLHQRAIDPKYFGEGIVIWKDRLIELTWQDKIGFVYELDSFKPVSQFHYAGEGWALTRSDHQLIMSDGTSDLRLFDPDRLTETGRIHVTCDSRPIHNINELEWVKGEIYANVWLTSLIIRIDPATGAVVGVIDLKDLTPPSAKGDADDVLNGIAYDAAADRLFVTGKRWPVLYQISLRPLAAGPSSCMSLP
jgi:glutaminyl-peptide cyclotransferase